MRDANDTPLESAIANAVESSLQEVAQLQQCLGELDQQLAMSRNALVPWCAPPDAGGAAATESGAAARAFVALSASESEALGSLIRRQTQVLRTFNLALFGRTGSGKSSLIEAMRGGDGSAISPGESDWTSTSAPFPWKKCLIFDTPGINGWGRSAPREDYEAQARQAVEVADFVLVCFDTQSQQVSEFEKLARWVRDFGKPIVAVLNSRNARWRFGKRVPPGGARSNLSRPVAEHARHIQDQLSALGLHDVPLVAISAKRAVFARAPNRYKGPDPKGFSKQRKDYGTDYLLHSSNLPALEDLLVPNQARPKTA